MVYSAAASMVGQEDALIYVLFLFPGRSCSVSKDGHPSRRLIKNYNTLGIMIWRMNS